MISFRRLDSALLTAESGGGLIVTNVDENTDGIQVFPNPTTGLLNVNGNGTMHITVSNMLGQKMMETTAEGNTTLDLSEYGQGMYIVRIENENGVTVRKVNVRQ